MVHHNKRNRGGRGRQIWHGDIGIFWNVIPALVMAKFCLFVINIFFIIMNNSIKIDWFEIILSITLCKYQFFRNRLFYGNNQMKFCDFQEKNIGIWNTYRVFIKYCVFPKISKYSKLWPFSVLSPCQCVYTHKAGRKPALQQNWQSSEKSQHFKEKTQYLMNTLDHGSECFLF